MTRCPSRAMLSGLAVPQCELSRGHDGPCRIILAKRPAETEIDALRTRAESAEADRDRLRELVECLLENDPDDGAADGCTVLDVWRKDATSILRSMRDGGQRD